MSIKNKPTMLMILDGFGLNPRTEGNAIAQATGAIDLETLQRGIEMIYE